MRKRRFLFFFYFFIINSTFGQFSPIDFSNLTLWLQADSGISLNSGLVNQWSDYSGNNLSATQVTSTNRPTFISSVPLLNNLPSVHFDGLNDNLQGGVIPSYGDSSLTIFVLASGDTQLAPPNYAGILTTGTNINAGMHLMRRPQNQRYSVWSNNTVLSPVTTDMPNTGFVPKLWGLVKRRGIDFRLLINGVQSATSTAISFQDTFVNASYRIGSLGSLYYYKGSVSEIIVYKRALNDAERIQVENYIYNKYAPPVNLGSDITQSNSFCPVVLNSGNRFISYLWSTGDTASQIVVSKSGSYWVRTTDVFNRVSSDTIQVTFPEVKLTQQDTTICLGSTLVLATQLAGNNFNYLWSNGSTTTNVAIVSAGSYYVDVSDGFNCHLMSDTMFLLVDTFKNTVSLGADTSLCAGDLISLQSPSNGWANLSFSWSSGQTGNSILVNNSGDYSLTVVNALGCVAIDTINVLIKGIAPIIDFSGDTLCFGENYLTHNLSITLDTSNIIVYNWNFGDGTFSSASNPTHLYSLPGQYQVGLEAITTVGCSSMAFKNVDIKEVPLANFSGGIGCVQNNYFFYDQSSMPNTASIAQWQWFFGDGFSSNTTNSSHIYSSAGSYNVELIVTSSEGCSDTVEQVVNILASAPSPANIALISPTDNSQIHSGYVNFIWLASDNAIRYTLLLSTDSLFGSVQRISNIEDTNYVVTNLIENQSYFWKVVAYNVCGDSVYSAKNGFIIFSPNSIQDLCLWLQADSGISLNSGLVNQWSDYSGNNLSATQVTSTNRPTFISSVPLLNNLPSVHFDGLNDNLQGGVIPSYGDSSLTIFVLASGDTQLAPPNYAGILTTGTNINAGMHLMRRPQNQRYSVWSNNTVLSPVTTDMPNTGFVPKLWGLVKRRGIDFRLLINGVQSATSTAISFQDTFVNASYRIGV
ncbi:MAG: PKD domain-containing protein [Chitinophagales bacterium]